MTTTVSGGSTAVNGIYTVHTLAGGDDLIVSGDDIVIEYLIAASGGGGVSNLSTTSGGGGGGGGLLHNLDGSNQTILSSGTYPVAIGPAGVGGIAGAAADGTDGGNATFNGLTAIGGGGGSGSTTGRSGGSGGGTRHNAVVGGSRTAGQGNSGAPGQDDGIRTGGGGGGAGTAGASGGGGQGGAGGDGLLLDITGTPTYYCAGGAGGSRGSIRGLGGLGGGGNGGAGSGDDANGLDATGIGCGGGGGDDAATGGGGDGSLGTVIVRYKTADLGGTTNPEFSYGNINQSGDQITVDFNKDITTDYNGFSLTADGDPLSVDTASSTGSGTDKIVLHLQGHAVLPGQSIEVSYNDAIGNAQDLSANLLASFSGGIFNSVGEISLLNSQVLEETLTAGFPGSPYNYTPADDVRCIGLLVASATLPITPPAPTIDSNPCKLIKHWHFGARHISLWIYETDSNAGVSVAVTGISVDSSVSYVRAFTLSHVPNSIRFYREFVGAKTPAPHTLFMPYEPHSIVLAFATGGSNTLGLNGIDSISYSDFSGVIEQSNYFASAGTLNQSVGPYETDNIQDAAFIMLGFGGSDSITLHSHRFNKIFRKDFGQEYATVPFSGDYSGTPSGIEVRVRRASDDIEIVTWTEVDSSPSGGSWSGSLQVPLGPGPTEDYDEYYYTEMRFTNDHSVVEVDRTPWFVGLNAIMYGQSNSVRAARTLSSTGFNLGVSDNGLIGRSFAAYGLALASYETGLPVNINVLGLAAQNLDQLSQGGSSGAFEAQVIPALASGGADFVIWQHGLADIAGTPTPEATYEQQLKDLHQAFCDQLGITKSQLPLIVSGPNRADQAYTAQNVHNIRKAQYDVAQDESNVWYSHSTVDLRLEDLVHIGGTNTIGPLESRAVNVARFALTAQVALGYGGSNCNFFIDTGNAEKVSDTQINVPVIHNRGTDFDTTNSGFAGFEVSFDSGSNWSSATGSRLNASTIQLTHASNPADPVLVRYLWGTDPNGDQQSSVDTMVRDNSDWNIPLNWSIGPTFEASGSSGPTLDSATIDAAGTTLTLVFDEAVTTDYTGLDVDGYTLSNWAGSGTDTLTATITQVYSDEAPALDYVAATGNLTGVTSGEELADLTDSAITNSSNVSPNPTVTTGAASSIGTATASVAGTVTSEGRESVTERGVVWATTTAPDIADNKVTAGTGAGAFSASLTGMPDNTLIYFRAFATNASGTSYGAEDTFTTLDDPNPTINSIRFSDGGTRIRIAFSEAVTGTTGFSVDVGTITYVSGSGSAVYLFSFTGTPTTVSYTPGNVVDSISQPLGASGPTAIDPEPTSDIVDFIVLRLF